MKSLFKSVMLITVFAVLTRITGFLFRIFLSRAIGAEMLGTYQVAFSVFIVLLTIVSSGLPLIISKISAKFHSKQDKVSEGRMISSALILALVSSIVLCALILALKNIFGFMFTDARSITILIILLPAVVFSSIYAVFRGSLWGHSNYLAVGFSEFFEQILRIIICIVLFVFSMNSYDGAIIAASSLSVACLLSAALVMILYFKSGGKLKKPDKSYKEIIKTSLPITGVRVATSLIQPIIAILIPAMLINAGYTPSQAMIQFGIAIGMTLPLLFIPTTLVGSLSMALVPDISTAICNNDKRHIENRIKSSISFALFISAFLIPLYIAVGEKVGIFFFDNRTSGALLAYSAWIMLPLGLTNITSTILNVLGYETKSFIHNILGAILLLACCIVLPQFIGIKALAIGMGLCMTLVSLLNIRMIRKKTSLKLNISKPILIMAAITIPTAAITAFLANLLGFIFPLFFVLAISCTIGALFFFYLCVIFKVVDVSSIFVKIKYVNFKTIFKRFKKNKII